MRCAVLAELLLVAMFGAACVAPVTAECDWGLVCAQGLVCHKESETCAEPEWVAACEDHDPGASCSYPNSGTGYRCRNGLCVEPDCGDGFLDATPIGEQCDDGNDLSNDGCSAACQAEQLTWALLHGGKPGARAGHGMVFDSARDRLVVVGGELVDGEIFGAWEYDGRHWLHPLATDPRLERSAFGFAYHTANGSALLFGGKSAAGMPQSDTLLYEDNTWVLVESESRPAPRYDHAMAYDHARQRVVLFGGDTYTNHQNDTWEFDGENWINVTPPDSPPPRCRHSMAYDPVRGRVVLFGGYSHAGQLGDTWEFDGTSWMEMTLPVSPTPRSDHALSYDEHSTQIVLFGGESSTGLLSDTWTYNGVTWRLMDDIPVSPGPRRSHALAYDQTRQRVLLFGGIPDDLSPLPDALDDLWAWDGELWTKLSGVSPPGAASGTAAYDETRQRLILLARGEPQDDHATTFEFDGEEWWEAHYVQRPPPWREGHTLTFLAQANRVVLFGGNARNDTCLYDGVDWFDVPAESAPPPRTNHAATADETHAVVVVFGGEHNGQLLEDTWQFDGEAWIQTLGAQPPGRQEHALAYDSSRKRVVLFGGERFGEYLDDTWEFDGITWFPISLAQQPPSPRAGHVLVYSQVLGATILLGGRGPDGVRTDCWKYDGQGWEVLPITSPEGVGQTAVYDRFRRRLIIYGGQEGIAYPSTRSLAYYSGGCGDNSRDPGEGCDGEDLMNLSCELLGFRGGVLTCRADCIFDQSGCF